LSTTASVRGWDGGITYNGEMAFTTLTCSFKVHKTTRGIGRCKAVSAGLLQDVQGFCFRTHGGDGGIEFAELVFVLAVMGDVGCNPPITQVDGCIAEELIV